MQVKREIDYNLTKKEVITIAQLIGDFENELKKGFSLAAQESSLYADIVTTMATHLIQASDMFLKTKE